MPEVNMDSAKLAEIALSLCSSAPHDFGGIVFKNASETHTSHIRSLFKSGNKCNSPSTFLHTKGSYRWDRCYLYHVEWETC